MRNYTTVQGDRWDIISLKVYGTELRMDALIDANFVHRNTSIFCAGVVLNVPDVDTTQLFENLPPWKRGGYVK